VHSLLAGGRTVRTLVRDHVPWLPVEQLVCDLCTAEPAVLASACAGADAVVHLAGENEVLASRDPSAALSSTVVASERLAEACRAAGVRRVVYLSTVHVYGSQMRPGATLTEDLRAEPRSAYAISRLASEHVAAGLAAGAYELVILRLTNSVGAPVDPSVDRWSLVTNDLARQGALEGRLQLRSSGMQWRDFVALDDVCAAIAAACRADGGGLDAGTYNLGSGTPTTVLDLAHLVQEEFEQRTGRRPELSAPAPTGEPDAPYAVSVQRLATAGLRPATPLRDAVGETVGFCLDHRNQLSPP
jgi:UDP-glucose 4-epimerase